MSRVGIEHTTEVFGPAKAVRALDRTAAVIGPHVLGSIKK
jgi:hypothetical protein